MITFREHEPRSLVPLAGSSVTTTALTPAEDDVAVYFQVAEVEVDDVAVRDYVSRLWADDWDSPEDSVYDSC